uniref:Uncharacterized protein n=1 Tax=Pseudonaja textilis TaxID=8673 RepID=A0A670ZB72_PSETE
MNSQKRKLVQLEILSIQGCIIQNFILNSFPFDTLLVGVESKAKSKKRKAVAGSGCGRGRWIHDYNGKSKHGPANSRVPDLE